MNQFATPGLGSMIGGRYVAGTGQLILAIVGFVLVIGWFVMKMVAVYQMVTSDTESAPYDWLGKCGGIVFLAAWLWSLVTSISLFIEAKRAEDMAAKNPPPRIE